MRVATLALSALWPLGVIAQDTGSAEFFERRIRPLLAEKCYSCHGAKLASGGLRVDSREAIRKGGNRGPAVVPGHLDLSYLARAVSYRDPVIKMPPAGRLTDDQIGDLDAWIKAGATDPRDSATPTSTSKRPWSFEPFREHTLPKTKSPAWAKTWIDHFVLAGLESKNLRPAPETDRRTWIRRVTFDLTGLPPSPAEIGAFLADRSNQAYERVAERLLASQHYGERWARHWLDLARYAETDGHEFDREKPNAWRYRDYVIRAFNSDIPYDRFVREQIAGDLDTQPRAGPGGLLETPLGTGFFALYEERNAADDLTEVRYEKLDNQIDTFSKTFLGLTVACARCHDHKFDPIPSRDYYALGGALLSKQVIQGSLDSPERRARQDTALAKIAAIRERISGAIGGKRVAPTDTFEAALKKLSEAPDERQISDPRNPPGTWLAELLVALREPDHLLHPIARLARPKKVEADLPLHERVRKLRKDLEEWDRKAAQSDPRDIVMDTRDWRADGPAFRLPSPVGEATGFLTSKTFYSDRQYMHVRLAGSSDNTSARQPGNIRVSLVGDGRDAVFTPDGSGRMMWRSTRLGKMFNEYVYVEFADRSRDGFLRVERVVLSDSKEPPATGRFVPARVKELLARDYAVFDELLQVFWPLIDADPAIPARPIDFKAAPPNLRGELSEAARELEDPVFGLISAEDAPRNLHQAKSGNPRNRGDEIPRAFLSALHGKPFEQGSGREELAAAITSPSNPLTARVFVNRVWKHHFGDGLVRTTDNFGSTGEQPSNPRLLDTLAARFAGGGWRVKDLHRTIVLSAAYRMSSRADPAAAAIDGDNRLLHHMPVRRLEAESIRDSILAVSGTLDRTSGGISVPPHISEYQDGRGKPQTGPLDGNGRRGIYLGVRRNFLPPMFVAFDYPPTVTTIGRRGSSTVPSQALILMNNEFVQKQAARWSERLAKSEADPAARVRAMFLEAFGRPAEAAEIDQSLTFLESQKLHYREDAGTRVWADFAHALFNSKEFIFIP